MPPVPEPPLSLEISSLRDVDAEIVDYPVHQGSRAANRLVRDLALPEGAVVAMISRDKKVIPPRGSTRIHVGDHVFIVVAPESRHPVDWVFTDHFGKDTWESHEIPVRGTTRAGDVMRMYNIDLQADPDHTLEKLIHQQAPQVRLDMMLQVGAAFLHVREIEDGRVITVGLVVPKPKITTELTEPPTGEFG
jgi:cell volume regulation protein A